MPSTSRFPEEFLPSQAHVERQRDYHTLQNHVPEPPSTRPGVPFQESPKVGSGSDFPVGPSQATGPKELNSKDRNLFYDNASAVPASIPHIYAASYPIDEYDSAKPPHLLPSRTRNAQHEKATPIQPARTAVESSSAIPEPPTALPSSYQESTPGPAVIFPKANLSETNQVNENHTCTVCSKLSSTSSHLHFSLAAEGESTCGH